MFRRKVITVLVFCLPFFLTCSKTPPPKQRIPMVKVQESVKETIPIIIPAFGHFVAYNSVDIKAQVEGVLKEIHYTEGKMVCEGDPLVTIDPRPYQAKLDLAIAEREQNLAQYNFASEKVERYSGLVCDNYVSILNFHEFETQRDSYRAMVEKNNAQIALAKIDLDYCFIKAPFTGVCGKKKFDIGNLVTNNGDTLVSIKQLDPIYIDFSIPERDFFRLMENQCQKDLNVEFEFPQYPDYHFNARLIVINNEIDQDTGMIPLRAEIRNLEIRFWPGQFIKTNLILRYEPNAIMIPFSAVSIGQKGRYVYVINEKNEAEIRYCEFGEILDQKIQVIHGVQENEKVVTEGQINLVDGIKVQIYKSKEVSHSEEDADKVLQNA